MRSRESKHLSSGCHTCAPSALPSRSSPQPLWCDHFLGRKREREMFFILGMLCSASCSYFRICLEVGITPWSVQWLCMCYTRWHAKARVYMGLSTPYCCFGPCLCDLALIPSAVHMSSWEVAVSICGRSVCPLLRNHVCSVHLTRKRRALNHWRVDHFP